MGQLPVIIIGAGISGLSLAHALSARGEAVVVLEQDQIGSGASGAAAAYLEPRTGTGGLRAIEWAALEQWPAYAEALESASGIDTDYRKDGLLHVALPEGLERLEREFAARQAAGTPVTWLDGSALRARQIHLSDHIAAGYALDQVHTLDGPKLCSALAAILQRTCADVCLNTAVLSLEVDGNTLRVTTNQDEFAARKVAICCAMGRNDIAGLPDDVPFSRPVRGVMLALAGDAERPLVSCVIKHAKGVICPSSDGRLMVGPTSEKGETSLQVTGEVRQDLLDTAAQFVPAVSHLEVSDTYVGLRALTGDGALKLGQSRKMPGVYYSLSHGGSGYLRAPVVAEELASYMLDETAPCPLTSAYLTRP